MTVSVVDGKLEATWFVFGAGIDATREQNLKLLLGELYVKSPSFKMLVDYMDTLTFFPNFSFAMGSQWGYANNFHTLFIPEAATTYKYIDVTGRAQQTDSAVAIAHEMYHAAFEFDDPVYPQFSSKP